MRIRIFVTTDILGCVGRTTHISCCPILGYLNLTRGPVLASVIYEQWTGNIAPSIEIVIRILIQGNPTERVFFIRSSGFAVDV